MTIQEKAIEQLERISSHLATIGEKEDYTEIAIQALEQEPILDKIRAEIEQSYCTVNNDYDHGRNYGLYMATQIIDKYKDKYRTEMEREEEREER